MGGVRGWMTSYDAVINFSCPSGRFLSQLKSQHSNHHEDRVWDFSCSASPNGGTISGCSWSGYVNSWDGVLDYTCPGSGVIAGTSSNHDNGKEDRRFKFLCCNINKALSHCHFTERINYWDEAFDYRAPSGYALTGLWSEHSNHHEDRRWKMRLCVV